MARHSNVTRFTGPFAMRLPITGAWIANQRMVHAVHMCSPRVRKSCTAKVATRRPLFRVRGTLQVTRAATSRRRRAPPSTQSRKAWPDARRRMPPTTRLSTAPGQPVCLCASIDRRAATLRNRPTCARMKLWAVRVCGVVHHASTRLQTVLPCSHSPRATHTLTCPVRG